MYASELTELSVEELESHPCDAFMVLYPVAMMRGLPFRKISCRLLDDVEEVVHS